MKTNKFLIVTLLILSMSLALFACGESCKNHADTNGDGLCEECGKAADPSGETAHDLTLIKDGEALFDIVLGNDVDANIRFTLTGLKSQLEDVGIDIEIKDESSTEAECEVLIGSVSSRGEDYAYNKYSLGTEGYTIKMIGKKIIVCGGSANALEDAVEEFINDVLKVDDLDEGSTVKFTKNDEILVDENEYDIDSIKIGGVDIADFKIAFDTSNQTLARCAAALQDALYKEAGYWLVTVPEDADTDNKIIIREAERDDTPEDSFRISVKGSTLYIETEYLACLEEQMTVFISRNIKSESGDIAFAGEVLKKDISFITYEDFGAKGDGKTNDFEAIKNTHDQANKTGQTVKAKNTSTYYISDTRINGRVTTIEIKTNVDWGTAKFIIDDTNLAENDGTGMYSKNIFTVPAQNESFQLSKDIIDAINAKGNVGRETTSLELGLDRAVMIIIYNENHYCYKRYGNYSAAVKAGKAQHELVIVDENGNFDVNTPLLHDYQTVTKITVYEINDTPLTITGGIFTTLGSQVDTSLDSGVVLDGYFKRGIAIDRSNTVIKDLVHYIEGQFTREETNNLGLRNPSYSGFISISVCNNVLIENCLLTAKRGNGTYDISVSTSNYITFKNCSQTNFFLKDDFGNDTKTPSTDGQEFWGIMGSNYSKNVTFDSCKLTRFDAHAGVYNGKIINSEVAVINLIGGGTMLIENTRIHSDELFSLRQDYGATWNGDVIIKDCTMVTTETGGLKICYAKWTNHDFGYTCYFPNIIVDNLQLEGTTANELILTSGSGYDSNQTSIRDNQFLNTPKGEALIGFGVCQNPYTPPKYLKIINNNSGIIFRVDKTSEYFKNTEIVGFENQD